MDLHEFAPVSGRATSGRHRRRFERFAEVCQDLPDLSRVGDEGDEPDVTATRWARKRKLLPHPGHQFRPGNSRGVVRAGLCMSVAAAFHGMSADSPAGGLPAGGGVAALANIPDRQRRDGFPQPVIRREYSWLVSRLQAMPVLPRRRDEIGEPVEELKRREFDQAVRAGPRGLTPAAGPDPGGGFVSGQHVTDAGAIRPSGPSGRDAGGFSPPTQPASGSRLTAVHARRLRSERVDVDHCQLVGGWLDDIAIVMHLDELIPIGGRSTGGSERRRFEGLAGFGA